ncbi:MAG TPA: PH domain-containing protein [Bacillota bacterium]|nr:PH domain-containing protein [Bacillota bacterium]
MLDFSQPRKFVFFEIVEPTEEMLGKLAPGEEIQAVFKTFRDFVLFTNRRIIVADKQGLTGRKVESLTIPYRSVVLYSMENAGTFDLEAELDLLLAGGVRVKFEFVKGKKTREMLDVVNKTLGSFLMG